MGFSSLKTEIISLSEISETKTSTMWSHLYVESTKQNKIDINTENKCMVARGEWMSEVGEGG